MKKYIIKHITSSLEESNDYLMKIWSIMLNNGKIGWHFRPNKTKSIIEVGDLTIHGLGNYFVEINCKTKKTISEVIFKRHDGDDINEREITYFNNLEKEINGIEKRIFIYSAKINIDSQFGVKCIYPFKLEGISSYCIENDQFFEFTVLAYSKAHADELGFGMARSLMDLLSVQTNSYIKLEKLSQTTSTKAFSPNVDEKNQIDLEWIDEYPIENNQFILPEYAKQMFSDIVCGKKISISC